MTATAPSTYVSGHCGSGHHEACRGTYAGVTCTCPHHTDPAPEPVAEVAPATRHCPTCACEDPR